MARYTKVRSPRSPKCRIEKSSSRGIDSRCTFRLDYRQQSLSSTGHHTSWASCHSRKCQSASLADPLNLARNEESSGGSSNKHERSRLLTTAIRSGKGINTTSRYRRAHTHTRLNYFVTSNTQTKPQQTQRVLTTARRMEKA